MRRSVLPFFPVSLFGSVLLSVATGSVRVPFESVLGALFGFRAEGLAATVIDLRLVRTVAALVSGASLGAAGAVLQSLFRNPLADPFVLGISSGSSLAIAATLIAGTGLGLISAYDPQALYVAGALGALAVSLAVVALSSVLRSNLGLVLVGVMLGYLASGLTTLLVVTSDVERVRAFTFWTLGTFSASKWSVVNSVLPIAVGSLLASLLVAKPLNALLFGEDAAATMGASVRASRVGAVAVAASLVSCSVVISGPVGFVGLAAPHAVRILLKTEDNRLTVPLSALVGAELAVLSDIAARTLMSPLELPVTAVTSLFGAPIVLALVVRRWGFR
jgi:iron complex transport system permease protein